MNYKRNLRIYEYVSYFLMLAATVVCFAFRNEPWRIDTTLLIIVLALFARLMMERTRFKSADAENDELKADLRRLTQLYAEEKKKNQNNN